MSQRFRVTVTRRTIESAELDVPATSQREAETAAIRAAQELPADAWERNTSGHYWCSRIQDGAPYHLAQKERGRG